MKTLIVGILTIGLLATCGPFAVGLLFDVTHGWTIPLWFLLGSAVVFTTAGMVAAGPGDVDDDLVRA